MRPNLRCKDKILVMAFAALVVVFAFFSFDIDFKETMTTA